MNVSMKIENIIEGYNRHLEDKRKKLNIEFKGHLVLQKEIYPLPNFKAYKEYKYTLWLYTSGKKPKEIMHLKYRDRVLVGQDFEQQLLSKMDIELSAMLFNSIGSDLYSLILKGEDNGTTDH